jgi:RNase P subunit RPR2
MRNSEALRRPVELSQPEETDKQTQLAQRVASSSCDNCSKLLLFVEKYEERLRVEVSY